MAPRTLSYNDWEADRRMAVMPIKIPREDRALLAEQIQDYLEGQFSEPVGNLGAEGILDFVLGLVAPYVYNQAVADARRVVTQQMERTDDELSYLEKTLPRRR